MKLVKLADALAMYLPVITDIPIPLHNYSVTNSKGNYNKTINLTTNECSKEVKMEPSHGQGQRCIERCPSQYQPYVCS